MKKFIDYGRLDDAADLLEEMKFHKIHPNTPVFTTLIGGCADAGNFAGAMRFYNALKKYGLKPDARTFSCLFKAVAKGLDSSATMEKVESLKAEMSRYGITPSLILQNAMLSVRPLSHTLSLCVSPM